jgi:hypothetical protein
MTTRTQQGHTPHTNAQGFIGYMRELAAKITALIQAIKHNLKNNPHLEQAAHLAKGIMAEARMAGNNLVRARDLYTRGMLLCAGLQCLLQPVYP